MVHIDTRQFRLSGKRENWFKMPNHAIIKLLIDSDIVRNERKDRDSEKERVIIEWKEFQFYALGEDFTCYC